MSYLSDYNVLKDIYFEKSNNEIDCLKAQRVKNIGNGIGHQGKIDFSSQHVFLKRLQEALTYKPDNAIRRKSDQIITQSKVPTRILRLSKDINIGNHIKTAKRLTEMKESKRPSKADQLAAQQDIEDSGKYQDSGEQDIRIESDESDSDMPFDEADDVKNDEKSNDSEKESTNKPRVSSHSYVSDYRQADRSKSYSIIVETCPDNSSEKSQQNEDKESLFGSNSSQIEPIDDQLTIPDTRFQRNTTVCLNSRSRQSRVDSSSTEKRMSEYEQTLRKRTSEIRRQNSNQFLVLKPLSKIADIEKFKRCFNEGNSSYANLSQASTHYTLLNSKSNKGRKMLRNRMKSMGCSSTNSLNTSQYSSQANQANQNQRPSWISQTQINQSQLSVAQSALIDPLKMTRKSFVDKLRGTVTITRTPCKHYQI